MKRSLGFLAAALLAVVCSHAQPADNAPEAYRLNSGDEIAITVVGEPDLSESLRIDSQGQINQKFLGLVAVAGRTIAEAERHLEQQLIEQKFLRQPVVRIKLVAYAQRGVVVFGAVAQPGAVNFPPETFSMDILDVIAKCGGFTANARRHAVRVKRRGDDGSDQVLTVNVRNMLSGRDTAPFLLQPGDVVTVDT
jgi:polysaccharide export outer membrane protein